MPAPTMLFFASDTSGPTAGALWRWGLLVLALHVALWMTMAGSSVWQWGGPQSLRVSPLQTRWLAPQPVAQQAAWEPLPSPASPQPRLATVAKTAVAEPASLAKVGLGPEGASQDAENLDKHVSKAHTPGIESSATDAVPIQASENAQDETVAQVPQVHAPAPEKAAGTAEATLTLPQLGLASLPASALLNYRLTGQEKGIPYQATGELRWQHNMDAYAMSLSIKAFLLGSRHWRSRGQITARGLAPLRFSDSWRSERAAHFDRAQNQIVFSSNAPSAPLQSGAQDQISLYPQLAAVMAQEGGRLLPGARLQVQTATVRDALPWLLTFEKQEPLQLDGHTMLTTKWVCQPRNRFDAQVEFWVAAANDWLPVRIRITQVSGNFIDLELTTREALPALPTVANPG
jgi:hypothetical protein